MRTVFTIAFYLFLHLNQASDQPTTFSDHTFDQYSNDSTEVYEVNYTVVVEWTEVVNETEPTQLVPTMPPQTKAVTQKNVVTEKKVFTVPPAFVPSLPSHIITEATTTTAKVPRGLDKYSPWGVWQCHHHCKRQLMFRERKCIQSGTDDGKCSRQLLDIKADHCYPTVCPTDCPDYKWGENCNGSCSNCAQPCNKFTGACGLCKKGFTDPMTSCVTEFQEKPESKTGYPAYYLLFLLIPVALCICCVCRGNRPVKKEAPRQKKAKSDPTSKDSAASMNVKAEAQAVPEANDADEDSKAKVQSMTTAVIAKIKSLTPRSSLKEEDDKPPPEPENLSRATSVLGVKGRV